MTHHDKARELVERLMQWDHCWPAPGLERDVESAADLITALAEENRRLREALRRAEAYVEHGGDREGPLLRHIRAALTSTGEKG